MYAVDNIKLREMAISDTRDTAYWIKVKFTIEGETAGNFTISEKVWSIIHHE